MDGTKAIVGPGDSGQPITKCCPWRRTHEVDRPACWNRAPAYLLERRRADMEKLPL